MTLTLKYQERRITLLLAGSAISILIILFPPLDIIENANLTVRMVEDILLFVYAILFGYGLERYASVRMKHHYSSSLANKIYVIIGKLNRSSRGLIFALLVPSVLLVYWNYPINFDLTAENILVRYVSDISYLVAAILVGMAIVSIPRKLRALLLYFTFMSSGMMGSMMLVWPSGFYIAYSASQNVVMNSFMMFFGALGVIGTSSWLLKVMDVI